jgi:DNA-binding MarR family transcriptional regulator
MGLAYVVGPLDHVLNQRLRDSLAPAGLSVPQYKALSVFRAHGSPSNARLATRTMISPQSANEMVKQMEAEGWIARTPDPEHGHRRWCSTERHGDGADRLACYDRAEYFFALSQR